jgi:very-short-patch-repair endonuclease
MINDSPQKRRRRSLRRRMTAAEQTLWSKLRSRRLATYKFQRQTSIDQYVVDFYCAEKKLIIELDGDVHDFKQQKIHDKNRQSFLESRGFRVLRFTNDDVKESMEGVLEKIIVWLELA